ncbi:MarR family winged helix-turn-helix transcriptional regulator [Ramlibacter sp. AN1133]|uniref:MarR family winged helix-turn-helix transcriptional regulator n=1 Tax=Ramlibacter sp. AN1133 TaxID=3133429 RepID=UPI0030C15F6C
MSPAAKTIPSRRQTPQHPPDAAAKVLRRFRVVFNSVKTHFRAVERTSGISGAQVWALSVVHAQPGIGVNELARAMDVHQSTASNLVRALQEAGMVVSEREGEDRRAVQLHATPRGRKALAQAPGPFEGVLPGALRQLDDRTLARLDRDLASLIRLLGPQASGRNVPLGARED